MHGLPRVADAWPFVLVSSVAHGQVPVAGQPPETPSSGDEGGDEGGEEGNPGYVAGPRRTAERNERVITTTAPELKSSEEPLAERVLRQVRSGELNESLPTPSPPAQEDVAARERAAPQTTSGGAAPGTPANGH